jgi:hypothetical protein
MILIAHRGNTNGKSNLENSPSYIDSALSFGYDVEVDLYGIAGDLLFTGHDYPAHQIHYDWLLERKSHLWIHCKNFNALSIMNCAEDNFTYFWHQEDKYTIVSNGYIWAYPGEEVGETKSIVVLPEITHSRDINSYGVCSDYISNYKNI